ncbi:helix-turn-helix transcriptional regulator [Clostridium perfringens]|uniref:helix-turn-helix domain-containing protein n=1 Tax=Clostridium perfringens TaxID=1502 RepID=UPI0018E493B7|nr:helix-turn-helix transcriptional regulator [Clostridium perfringens]EHK2401885.1 helix-turn-helix transcriptional regulator [Clostridium perfringens]EJT6543090.1 helix-turn-helix transcriptional regulator [Clostridium perfringens]EJT6568111.1 helix-turn-helix transcriptional regulator [Clostridium perfringens]MBS5995950.1 helix-turn-helix transcriptional regulator [Clostridium perfringens]MCI2780339.1 helix-turn-helix domain-containing protein [Clostridium perfringens]
MIKIDNLSFFPNNLKTLRKLNLLSQAELSKLLGISRSSLSFYESGESEPTLNVLIKISKFFNVSLDYLIFKKIDSKFLANLISYDSLKKQNLDTLEKLDLLDIFKNKKNYYISKEQEIHKNIEDLNSIIKFLES